MKNELIYVIIGHKWEKSCFVSPNHVELYWPNPALPFGDPEPLKMGFEYTQCQRCKLYNHFNMASFSEEYLKGLDK